MRLQILDAATTCFADRGRAATLSEIAESAGVSKGGLLYHFPSKAALQVAVCKSVLASLWNEVNGLLDGNDATRGRLHRAYVRALTGDSEVAVRIFWPTALPLVLSEVEETRGLLASDAHQWREAFREDGVEEGLSLVIRHSAEGAAAAAGEEYIHARELALIRSRLLEMLAR